MSVVSDHDLNKLKSIVGDKNYYDTPQDKAPFEADWRGRKSGKTPLVLFPTTTKVVSKVVTYCHQNGIKMVPQGGNTGLVMGGIPSDGADEIIINLSRMNEISNIDPKAYTITCQAGATLQSVQEAATEKNRLFPLSLAAEGSCQIGGNIATNAGGIHVLRYGNMREQILGLEVVLPNGEIWNGLKSLRKDNAGYDLKQIFIGAEGTLGIITEANMKLYPKPSHIATAAIGFKTMERGLNIFSSLREAMGDNLVAFEIFPQNGLDIVLKHLPQARAPLNVSTHFYAIAEIWAFSDPDEMDKQFSEQLMRLIEQNQAQDIALIQNQGQRENLWTIRESLAPALKREGAGFAFDLSIPISQIPEFLDQAARGLEQFMKGIQIIAFGHLGDGNIHYNIAPPKGMDVSKILEKRSEVQTLMHDLTYEFSGSIAAEHGVGVQKVDALAHYKSPTERALFKSLKQALDPKNLMNAGRIIKL